MKNGCLGEKKVFEFCFALSQNKRVRFVKIQQQTIKSKRAMATDAGDDELKRNTHSRIHVCLHIDL